eukprot:6065029-Prymnesium_polylepis.1
MPLLAPAGAKELTFTLSLDRSGATADTVTINAVLYLKKSTGITADEEEAPLVAEPPSKRAKTDAAKTNVTEVADAGALTPFPRCSP